MKSLTILLFLLISFLTNSQDKIYGFYDIFISGSTTGTVAPNGLEQIAFTPSSNKGSFSPASSSLSGEINHIGINKYDFLYSVEGIATDNFHVNSYNTKNNFSANRALSNISLNGGNGSDARVRGMAIDKNDVAWVTAFSVIDGKNYVTTFKTNSSGSATDLQSKPYILKADLTTIEVKDLAFDFFGNLYALVLDGLTGYQYIYYINAKALMGVAQGGDIVLSKLWQISEAAGKPIKYDPKYFGGSFIDFQTYNAEGIAFSSEGQLLISVDKMSFTNVTGGYKSGVANMLYVFKPDGGDIVPQAIIYTSPENKNEISYCADLASNYYPAFLPLSFGEINATIQGNKLHVSWATIQERNNVKFSIFISPDGGNFSEVGSVNTLATGGNANDLTNYSFDYNLSNAGFLALFPVWSFLFLSLALVSNKKSRWLICFCIILFGFVNCSKKNTGGENIKTYNGKLFVKITATDSKGKTIGSKVIQASR